MGNTRIEHSNERDTPQDKIIYDWLDVGNGKYELRKYTKEANGAIHGPFELDDLDMQIIEKVSLRSRLINFAGV
jgi:hypothetical protein